MFKKTLLAMSLAAGIAMPLAGAAQAANPGAPGCQFVLGFATLAGEVSQVGSCLDNQAFAANGDALQHTSGGLLVWRKADNWTAFTDGYRTWVNGPNGLQERLNTDRFAWEAAAPPAPASAQPANSASDSSSLTTSTYTPPTAASLGLSGASVAELTPPQGPAPSADDIAQVTQPAGQPTIASLPVPVQIACVDLSQDLRGAAASGQSVGLRKGDLLCPYAQVPGWDG